MGNCTGAGKVNGGGMGEVGGVLFKLRCGCVGDENGVGPSELSVDDTDGELDLGSNWGTGRSTNCPHVFLKGIDASVTMLKTRLRI